MMRAATIALVLVLGSLAVISGADAQGGNIVVGAGTQKCVQWTATDKTQSSRTRDVADEAKEAMIKSWFQGYLVGEAVGIARGAQAAGGLDNATLRARFGTRSGWAFDPPNADIITDWLRTFCREKPLANIADAADALISELLPPANGVSQNATVPPPSIVGRKEFSTNLTGTTAILTQTTDGMRFALSGRAPFDGTAVDLKLQNDASWLGETEVGPNCQNRSRWRLRQNRQVLFVEQTCVSQTGTDSGGIVIVLIEP
jgi:hypothetical protein